MEKVGKGEREGFCGKEEGQRRKDRVTVGDEERRAEEGIVQIELGQSNKQTDQRRGEKKIKRLRLVKNSGLIKMIRFMLQEVRLQRRVPRWHLECSRCCGSRESQSTS